MLGILFVLTTMNGKMRPIREKTNQRWNPSRTKDATRSDWMKISVLRVPDAPPGRSTETTQVSVNVVFYGENLLLGVSCDQYTRSSTEEDDEEDHQTCGNIRRPGTGILQHNEHFCTRGQLMALSHCTVLAQLSSAPLGWVPFRFFSEALLTAGLEMCGNICDSVLLREKTERFRYLPSTSSHIHSQMTSLFPFMFTWFLIIDLYSSFSDTKTES